MALFAANRKDAGVEPVVPLSSYMEVSTVKKYCGVWKQVLCYIWRSQAATEPAERPAYQLTRHQAGALLGLQCCIQEF